jgi:hypothetical protein
MDAHSFSSQVEVLSVTDSGRRRRWSAAEKIRIVEESLSRPRSVALTARRPFRFRRRSSAIFWKESTGAIRAGRSGQPRRVDSQDSLVLLDCSGVSW